MSNFSEIKGLLSASRVPNLLIVAGSQLAAAVMLERHGVWEIEEIGLFLLIITTMMVAAGGYIINDYYDAKIDLVNRPNQVVIGKTLSRRKALVAHLIISGSAVLFGAFVSWKIALLHLFSVSLLWYYSNHLRRLFIGKIAIGILSALTLLSLGVAFGVTSYRLMAFATFGGAIIWIRELVKDLENDLGERQFGVQNVPSVWGVRGTKNLITAVSIIGMSLLVYFMFQVDSKLFYYYYLALSPLTVLFGARLYRADRKDHYRSLRHLINFLILAGLASMLVV